MKRLAKALSLFMTILLITMVFAGCKKETPKNVIKIRLNEVVRSVFYAPMYAAINKGFFAEEGIEIELTTGQGADATPTKTQVFL